MRAEFQIGTVCGTPGQRGGRVVLDNRAEEEFASCCGVNLAVGGRGRRGIFRGGGSLEWRRIGRFDGEKVK